MKHIKVYLLILIASLLIFSISCEKVINLNIEDAKIKIVLNGIISSDSAVIVHISKSRHILDNAQISFLSDAQVKLYENETEIGTMIHIGNGFYKINYTPKKGFDYKVAVSHSNYDDAYATTRVLNSVQIISIDTFTTYGQYQDNNLNFNLKFTDPIDEKNYYMLTLINNFYEMQYSDTVKNIDTLYVGPDTTIVYITYGGYVRTPRRMFVFPNTEDVIIESQLQKGLVFSDELINGKTYTLRFNTSYYNFWGDTNRVYVQLKSIPKELYLYYKSLQQYYNNHGDPFSEPVMVYTNVVNGLGIFSSQSIHSDSLMFINTNNQVYYYNK